MRTLLTALINTLLSTDADAGGVAHRSASPQRSGSTPATSYRHHSLDTRVGTMEWRKAQVSSEFLLPRLGCSSTKSGPRPRSSASMTTCFLLALATQQIDKLVAALGITSLSKSPRILSRIAADLDEQVKAFRTRRLDESGPFAFLAADALTKRFRENGRVVNAVVLVATAVNADGHREVLASRSPPARPERHGTPSSPTLSHAA